jgi:hypothetical protein
MRLSWSRFRRTISFDVNSSTHDQWTAGLAGPATLSIFGLFADRCHVSLSSSRRVNFLRVLQAIQHGRCWARQEARS